MDRGDVVALQAGEGWKNCAAHDISEEFASGFRMREAEASGGRV